MNIRIPLVVENGRFSLTGNLKESIDLFLELLLNTPRHSCPSDPSFGFVFRNLRFEIFNEDEGVVYNSDRTEFTENDSALYEKKLSGSSRNINTFAAELKDAIVSYERRLSNVNVAMTYMREERRIYIAIKGVVTAMQQEYMYSTSIKIWN
jgi:predicted component of type VI protein secretion system